jgi:N-acetylmuramoyl-L-alanine amidase
MAEIVPSSIALWKPWTGKGTTLLTHDIICVHTMVGTLPGSWQFASGAGRSYWHFGTSGLGECWQCHDLRFRSAANLNGNHRVIPIENADMGPGFGPWNGQCGHVPPFTAAQVDKLIQLIAWLCARYAIPPNLIPDTLPGRRGIAYHRQGINPWRCGACELWSNSTGKCCPDGARIGQLTNLIIPGVRAVLSGTPLPPSEDLLPTVAEMEKLLDDLTKETATLRLVRHQRDDGFDGLYVLNSEDGTRWFVQDWFEAWQRCSFGVYSPGGGPESQHGLEPPIVGPETLQYFREIPRPVAAPPP